jgi:phage/plasmid-associated DNA primase
MGRKVRHQRSKDPTVIEQLRHKRAIAGIERQEFFADGGDLKQWRPPKRVEVDRKRRASKNACRGRVKC